MAIISNGKSRCWKNQIRMMWLRHWLAHPLTQGLNLDDPQTTKLRRRIIMEKPFLREVYKEWYTSIIKALPDGDGAVLELGSGAGFLSEYIPDSLRQISFHVMATVLHLMVTFYHSCRAVCDLS